MYTGLLKTVLFAEKRLLEVSVIAKRSSCYADIALNACRRTTLRFTLSCLLNNDRYTPISHRFTPADIRLDAVCIDIRQYHTALRL